jgi:hypothetical protein
VRSHPIGARDWLTQKAALGTKDGERSVPDAYSRVQREVVKKAGMTSMPAAEPAAAAIAS